MSQRNRFYITIIILSALLTALNVSIARNQSDYKMFDPLVDVVDLVQRYYVSDTEQKKLISSAINGMLHDLDPYSEFIPAEELEEFDKQTSGSYEGIGIAIDIKNGYLTVISPFEDSPAYQVGVLPGDIILEVAGASTKGWTASRAIKMLTGPAGSKVTIKVLHTDGDEETVTITRQRIHVPTVRGWRRRSADGTWDYLIDPENRIGYIRITQFTGDTLDEFDRAVKQLQEQNMRALVLDLRSNPGGIMTAAVDMVDRMIDHGTILSTRGAHTPTEVKKAKPEGTYPRFHLVVLIDQGSASASEIVAGALQDHGRAVIVGKRSWGKGSVQRLIRLPDSGATLKLTTDYYYLPKGRCVHRRDDAEQWGVTPDVEQAFNSENADQLRELMEQLTIQPLADSRRNNGKEDNGKNTDPSAQKPPEKTSDQPPAVTSDDPERIMLLADQLLQLDDQLSQAVKQCKGLIRTRPALPALAEIGDELQQPESEETSPPDTESSLEQ